MSREANIQLHLATISEARKFLPIGSDRRISIISRSIQGILRAKAPNYNPNHI